MKEVQVSRSANANLQNQINRSIVFNYLRSHGPSYRAEIAEALGLSAPAVSRAVEHLLQVGYLQTIGKKRTPKGRRADFLDINVEQATVIGIDLLSDRMRLAMFDLSGSVLASRSGVKIAQSSDVAADLVNEVDALMREVASGENSADRLVLRAICVGVPAVVDTETEQVVDAYLFESLRGIDFRKVLSERYKAEVFLENSVKLAALAEKRHCDDPSIHDLVFIDVSSGVGAGIIVDDHLLRGSHGAAGEIGYTTTSTVHSSVIAGNQGYMESIASTKGIVHAALQAIEAGHDTVLTRTNSSGQAQFTAAEVFAAALEGDIVARTVVDSAVELLAITTLNLILIVDPQLVVFGGDMRLFPGARELVLEPIRALLNRDVPMTLPTVDLSRLRENAAVVGASLMAIESLLAGDYPYYVEL
jgi:predicted NBD/HSP70 family sugar kinase